MHFNPGIGSVYSNFGYGILGEIVTKVSGMSYEQYIKSHILNPLGVYDMSIGYSDKNKRLKNEVFYYEADSSYIAFDYRTKERDSVMVRRAYGGTDIQTLGSAGGWVASAIDLIKIILTVDGYNTVPDIISEMMLDTIRHVNSLDIQGIKIHSLLVLKYILLNLVLPILLHTSPGELL